MPATEFKHLMAQEWIHRLQTGPEWNRELTTGRRSPAGTATRPLQGKGAAWVAGLPVTNAVLPVAGGRGRHTCSVKASVWRPAGTRYRSSASGPQLFVPRPRWAASR